MADPTTPAPDSGRPPPDLHPGRPLNVREVAHLLDVSERTVWRMVKEGKFSRPRRAGDRSACWYEMDLAVYRYRVLRGDFDPPGGELPTPEDEAD